MSENKKIPVRLIVIIMILTALVGGFCLFAANSGRGRDIGTPAVEENNSSQTANSLDLVKPEFLK